MTSTERVSRRNPVRSTFKHDEFAGWWHRFGEFVFTYVSADPTGPPSTLVDPSPLASAVPEA